MAMLEGSCLCRGIRYEVDGAVTRIDLCHCSMCRKASGTAFAANSPVPRGWFRLVAGEALLRGYASSPGEQRYFCSNCGSPIYSHSENDPELLRLRIGALDTPVGHKPDYHFMVEAKADWDEIRDDLPCYSGFEPESRQM